MKSIIQLNPKISLLLRVGISISLLTWVVTRVGFSEITQHALNADPILLLLALILFQVGVLIRTLRWSILLRAKGFDFKFSTLLTLNYSGTFFNIFLPTGFGGDILRMVEAGRSQPGKRTEIAGIVLLDRFSGLTALFTLFLLALPSSKAYLPPELFIALFGIALAGLLAAVAIFLKAPIRRFQPLFQRLPGGKLVDNLLNAILSTSQRALLMAWLASICFHILTITIHFNISQGLHVMMPYRLFGVFTPVVSLTLLLPSIQGLGIRENVYGFLLSQTGYPDSLGVSIGLLVYAITASTGILGGIVYLIFGLKQGITKTAGKGTNSGDSESA